jgi:diaminopimelate epimerase
MEIPFFKFHGALNDFVVLDGRDRRLTFINADQVKRLCDRRAGVGADGVIVLKKDDQGLRMVYYNSDGFEGSMCGNGGRCFAAFARMLELTKEEVVFRAYDGEHRAQILNFENDRYWVALEMGDVETLEIKDGCYVLNTGSPHFVRFSESVKDLDVVSLGRSIRNAPPYSKEGINVNFAAIAHPGINIRTYERGVEAETMACGTGSVAVAIAAYEAGLVSDSKNIQVHTLGGTLEISFTKVEGRYTNIVLTGPATMVFQGTILLD